ncbi:unnamed protein product (macronuclear) [Paramecium tetraurelia]|uniref:Uncharacterized protein n=1 Tax=Paramecium tetraurelia TaxID=5888 RepID=A0BMZ9_PARTE|nr:uncharacterized protein GSPATT00030553001 [Paramecium tetraurelia]CAK59916.1 unnamed protein product [Paramecium tetraurelia]|eukprot:XP_001427314.1 hypothetical protein (macronuclear) [Paramecium tetraurelia strain d4-2]
MNFYTLEFEEQVGQDLREQEQIQVSEEQMCEYDQSSNLEINQDITFDGYLQEEPVLLFNIIEESPKKKNKSIFKKSKKIRKSDTETDFKSQKKTNTLVLGKDVAKLRQCKVLKTIISQMESILKQTRTYLLNQYQKQK